jgi:hypothetical protein
LKIPIPEIFREKLGKSITRVVLIANNPAITRRLVDDVVKDGDLLVLFNAPAPLDHVAHRPQPKLFFFRAKGATGNHWGLPPLVNRIGEIELLVGTGELALAYSRYPPHRANLPQGILALLDNSRTSMLVPEQHAAWKDYPVRPKIEFSGPSSGFMIYRLSGARLGINFTGPALIWCFWVSTIRREVTTGKATPGILSERPFGTNALTPWSFRRSRSLWEREMGLVELAGNCFWGVAGGWLGGENALSVCHWPVRAHCRKP